MHLEKFYVDVVGTDGSGCIGYAARLDGFGLAATIATTLRWDAAPATAPEQRRTMHGTLPAVAKGNLTWNCPALALAGTWNAQESAGAERTLWAGENGAVCWQALAPRARVELQLDGRAINGWGYAERLSLNLPPWQLPIDGLLWGRFVSPTHSAVWIEWQHPTPRRWLWHSGTECAQFTIAENGLSWSDGAVAFGALRTLRSGRLASTAFAHWPRMQRWLPKRIQALDETKWCAPGTLTDRNGATVPGWVIHEHVRFR